MPADPSKALLTRLGKYSIDAVLGGGAMGVVYSAHDPEFNQRVAIKTIHKELLAGSDRESLMQRFRNEAIAGRRLKHPNIVATYDFKEDQGVYFIVMEYVDGARLKDFFITGKRFTLLQTLDIMLQLLDALQYAHRHGVVHRDINPANIMLTASNQVQVTDLGIAKIESSNLTATGMMIGTPSYMSPEQCLGRPVDARTDIFAAGVVLYQMLTGEKPFAGESAIQTIQKILNLTPAPPSQLNARIPAGLDAIVQKAIAKQPENRFQSAQQFADSLRAIYEIIRKAEEASTRQPWLAYALDQVGQPRMMVASVALVALLASALGWRLWTSIPSDPEPLAAEETAHTERKPEPGLSSNTEAKPSRAAREKARKSLVADETAQQEMQRALLAEEAARREAETPLAKNPGSPPPNQRPENDRPTINQTSMPEQERQAARLERPQTDPAPKPSETRTAPGTDEAEQTEADRFASERDQADTAASRLDEEQEQAEELTSQLRNQGLPPNQIIPLEQARQEAAAASNQFATEREQVQTAAELAAARKRANTAADRLRLAKHKAQQTTERLQADRRGSSEKSKRAKTQRGSIQTTDQKRDMSAPPQTEAISHREKIRHDSVGTMDEEDAKAEEAGSKLATEQDKASALASKLQDAGVSTERVTALTKARENAEAAYRRLGEARDDPRTPGQIAAARRWAKEAAERLANEQRNAKRHTQAAGAPESAAANNE